MTQEIQNTESCSTQKKACLFHKIFGLKGLSNIYKVLSIITLVVMVVDLGRGLFLVKDYLAKGLWTFGDVFLWALQTIITYSFYALIFFTISRVLRVLKKIKHAVCNK